MKARILLVLLCLLLAPALNARTITDSAGRKVEVPDTINRVMAAGPPSSVVLYTLVPEKLVGWINEFPPPARPFIAAPYIDLPVHGRLTGRGNTASLETVISMHPDVIIDVGVIDPTYISLADKVQQQLGIPYVLIDGTFAKSADSFRLLGAILDVPDRAAPFAAYAEKTLGDLKQAIAGLPQDKRPRVYYGRGAKGLETGLAGSINLELLEEAGANNVAAAVGKGGLTNVSLEQVIGWDPDVILISDPNFFANVAHDPAWSGLRALRSGHVFHVPDLPWGWFDSPPSVNRLIGIRWLLTVLYPDRAKADLRAETREFYKMFYHVDLSEAQVDQLVTEATQPAK